MLLVAAGLGLVFLILGTQASVEISYSDLVRLVKKSAEDPEKTSDPYIDITSGSESQREIYRYRHLQDVKIGTHEITGKLNRSIVALSSKMRYARF